MLHTWAGPIHEVHGERGDDHESKNKRERENVGDARIEMMEMKRVKNRDMYDENNEGYKGKRNLKKPFMETTNHT